MNICLVMATLAFFILGAQLMGYLSFSHGMAIEIGVLILIACLIPNAGVRLERKWRDLQAKQRG